MSNKVELLYLIKSLFDELYEIEDYIQKARRKRTRRKKAGDKRPPAHWFYEKVYTFMKRGMPKENAIRLAAWIWYHRAGRKAKQKHKRLAKQKKYQRRASRYKALISRVGRRKGKRKSSLDKEITGRKEP